MADNKIFVSYRRQDASGEAGRLVDHLQEIYGEESVFLDVETLEAGLDFVQAIEKALNSSKVLIAMIGPHWLNVTDSDGNQRLFQDGDFIRIEISAALRRNIRVIPVLVNGAVMPRADQLPEDLQGLTRRHAQEISSSRWKYDCDQLVAALSKIIEPKPQPFKKPIPTPLPPKKEKSWLAKNYLWLLGAFVGLILLVSLIDTSVDEPLYDPTEFSNQGNKETNQPVQSSSTEDFQQLREENPEGTEIYDNLSTVNSNTESSQIEDITGYWVLSDNQGNTSTLIFDQYGSEIEFVEYNIFNVEVGQGSGEITDTKLTTDYYNSLVQVNGKIILTTSDQGSTWSGTISFPSMGVSTAISLQRINP